MQVLVILVTLGLSVNALSYWRSADRRLRRWTRKWGIQYLAAFAHAEATGLRIRVVDKPGVDTARRLVVRTTVRFSVVLVVAVCVLWWVDARWWVSSGVLTLVLLAQFNPHHLAADVSQGFRTAPGTTLRGLVYVTLGSGFTFVAVTTLWLAACEADAGSSVARWGLMAVIGVATMVLAPAVMTRAKRTLAQTWSIRFGRDSSPEDTLFLRSFNDDAMRFRAMDPHVGMMGALRGSTARFEELVAAFTARNSNLIAIGKPGESLPRLGATRTYVSNDEWQDAVEQTARRVDSIVLIAGTTDGLRWELSHLRAWGLAHKMTILLPPTDESQAWNRLHRLLAQLGIDFNEMAGSEETGEILGVLLRTVTAIGVDEHGRPYFYVSSRRDWVSFAATISQSQDYVRGYTAPPDYGEFAEYVGIDFTDAGRDSISAEVADLRGDLTESAEAVVRRAISLAPDGGPDGTGVAEEHLLLALLSSANDATDTIVAMRVDTLSLRDGVRHLVAGEHSSAIDSEEASGAGATRGGSMFERFDNRARRAVVLAQEESRARNHSYIGTEHILLGLLQDGGGVGMVALEQMSVPLEAVREAVHEIIGQGDDPSPERIPFTPRAKKVLTLALHEALLLDHDYIGTEHILLGLVREGDGVAALTLRRWGVDLGGARAQVSRLLP